MVVVFFYLIATIVLERYICRTENRKQVEKKKRLSDAMKPVINKDQLFMPVPHNDLTVKLIV